MKILLVDSVHPVLEEKFETAGFSVDNFNSKNLDELIQILPQYEGLIIRSKFKLTAEVLKHASELKFIGRAGAGLENIDLDYARQNGIKTYNSPEGNRDAVGEQAIGMLLSLLNNLRRADTEVRQGIWQREKNRGIELKGKTVGIIGYGNMGSSFAKKLTGFDVNIIAYDKYKKGFGNEWVKEVDYATIFEQSDILSLHVPLTNETRYLVNAEYLSMFKKNIILINTARGAVVRTVDLVNALKSGVVKAAALDVLEHESLTFENLFSTEMPTELQELIAMGNVLLSPHIAGWTHESNYKIAQVLADKILADFG